MATISITIGPLSSTANATNAKAADVVALFVEQRGGPVDGTNQEKLDWTLAQLVKYLSDNALDRRRELRRQEVEALATGDTEGATWV